MDINQTEMTQEKIQNIFREVANGVGNHGSFLVSFSECIIRADSQNFYLLRPVAISLIEKYGLEKYEIGNLSEFALSIAKAGSEALENGAPELPSDFATEHDHYLYGSPKRAKSDDFVEPPDALFVFGRAELMQSFRDSTRGFDELTADDCKEIFLGILPGGSDITYDLFHELLEGYDVSATLEFEKHEPRS